jgi:hypothetical protein
MRPVLGARLSDVRPCLSNEEKSDGQRAAIISTNLGAPIAFSPFVTQAKRVRHNGGRAGMAVQGSQRPARCA